MDFIAFFKTSVQIIKDIKKRELNAEMKEKLRPEITFES